MPVIDPGKYFDGGQFLKAVDFKKGETVAEVEWFEEIKTSISEHSPALRLKGYEAPFGLNSTNMKFMIEKYGDNSDKWTKKKVTIYKVKTTNPSTKKEVDGLRLK